MSFLPKVYTFLYVTKDMIPNSCYVVARNEVNAVKWFNKAAYDYPGCLPNQYCYIVGRYSSTLLSLLLPGYKYKNSAGWTKWRPFSE